MPSKLNCIIKHGNVPRVLEELKKFIPGIDSYARDGSDAVRITGGYPAGHDDYAEYVNGSFRHSHKFFDATIDMAPVCAFFGAAEPVALDETPLPTHTSMTPKQEDKVRKKFNLSPEQWLMLPPLAREALHSAKVSVVNVEHKWIPVEEWERRLGSNTVWLTDNPEGASGNARSYSAIGYKEGRGFEITGGNREMVPTHYCPLPGGAQTEDYEAEEAEDMD